MKMVLKGCRRCGGDLFPDGEDREGRSMYCLQCGLTVRMGERPRQLAGTAGPHAAGPRAAGPRAGGTRAA